MTPAEQLELIRLLNLAVIVTPKIAQNVSDVKAILASEVDMVAFAAAITDENAATQAIVDDLKGGA